MFRYRDLEENEYYREIFESEKDITIDGISHELDFYAYKHIGTELETYKILDINFINYIEQRGDISRIKEIYIPVEV